MCVHLREDTHLVPVCAEVGGEEDIPQTAHVGEEHPRPQTVIAESPLKQLRGGPNTAVTKPNVGSYFPLPPPLFSSFTRPLPHLFLSPSLPSYYSNPSLSPLLPLPSPLILLPLLPSFPFPSPTVPFCPSSFLVVSYGQRGEIPGG